MKRRPGLTHTFATIALVLMTIISLHPHGVYASGTISGTVFRDFNDNGVKDAAETTGVAGITVTAYDASNVAQGTATTAATGTYTLSATAIGPYRIEFTGLPSYLQPSAFGTNDGTTVQFVPDGTSSNINLGLLNPNDYSQPNPPLATTLMRSGSGVGSTLQGQLAFNYTDTGTTAPATSATTAQIGSAWGEAWQRSTKSLFLASSLRRYTGFANGPGFVYLLNYSAGSSNVPLVKVNLQGTAPANGGAAIDLGSVCRRSTTDGTGNLACDPAGSGLASDYVLSANPAQASVDLDAFAKVGTISYGDIDLSEDGNTLWLVNLNQSALISVDVSAVNSSSDAAFDASLGTINQYPLAGLPGLPTCTNGVFRPWALSFHDGYGYLGGVCSGETETATTNTPPTPGDPTFTPTRRVNTNISAHVLRFVPAAPASGFTDVMQFPLNYRRETASTGNTTGNEVPATWQPWAKTWSDVVTLSRPNNYYSYSQPILSDIEFADDGALVLGFLDRFASQSGIGNLRPVSGSTTSYGVVSGGDLIRACAVGTAFVLEGTAASCPVSDPGGTNQLTNDGPSNTGEFFHSDFYQGPDGQHYETTQGGLAHLAGSGEIISIDMDPISIGSGGTRRFSTTTGNGTASHELSNGGPTQGTGLFYKANGLGDLELLANPAPVEIGNRVWLDPNHNGIQDANEPSVAGVTVHLYAPNGVTLLGTAVTDAKGNYYFSNATGTSTTSAIYGIAGMTFNTAGFQIRLDNPANYAVGGPLYEYTLTTPNVQTGDSDASGDIADSDGTLADPNAAIGTGNFPTKSFNVGAAGFNNHTYDFGFFRTPAITMRKLVNGADANNPNGTDVPVIAPGQLATWTYVVTNTGTTNIPRADISVTDNVVGNLMTNGVLQTLAAPYTGAVFGSVDQLSPDNVLSPGEVFELVVTWRVPDFSAQDPAASPTDQWVLGCGNGSTNPSNQRVAYENIGTTTIPTQSVSDTAHLCNPTSAITLRKLVNGADANDPNGTDVPVIAPGQLATWTYVITNTGTVSIPRADISVTDDVVGNLMTNGVLQTLAAPYTGTVFGSVDQLSPDNVLSPGEVFQLVVTWSVPDFSAQDPAASPTDQWVVGCGNGSTNPGDQRVAYENTGTVTIPTQSVSDDAHICNPPVTPNAIALTYFTATAGVQGVTVQWATSAEIDTFGFHLLRSSDGDLKHAVRVTPTLIPAQGRGQGGASYSWTDTIAKPSVTYTYWLEETETDGSTHIYGPTQTQDPSTTRTYRVMLPAVVKR